MPRGSRRLILPLGFSPAKADADRAIASVASVAAACGAAFCQILTMYASSVRTGCAGNLLSARADEAEPLVRPAR